MPLGSGFGGGRRSLTGGIGGTLDRSRRLKIAVTLRQLSKQRIEKAWLFLWTNRFNWIGETVLALAAAPAPHIQLHQLFVENGFKINSVNSHVSIPL
jgi:hypothetical protein